MVLIFSVLALKTRAHVGQGGNKRTFSVNQRVVFLRVRFQLNVFFCTRAFFSLPTAGRFSCSRLRGTPGARPYSTAQVWALAEVRGTCSGGSKSRKNWQVTTATTKSHPGACRPTWLKNMSHRFLARIAWPPRARARVLSCSYSCSRAHAHARVLSYSCLLCRTIQT